MRFEIRAPGAIAILLSVVTLSGAVFALGLIAGHEMARQNTPDQNQLSTTYPLPPASDAATAPAPSVATAPALSPAAASSTASSMSAASAPKIPAPVLAAKPPAPAVAPAVARANPPGYAPAMKPPAAAHPPAADEEEDESTASAEAPASAAAPPPAGIPHKPYNIQIEAVMDKSGADEMVSRLKTLGYTAQELKTNLNGQVWYRVQVGPYNSEDEARAAQDKLRQQYKQAYTTSH